MKKAITSEMLEMVFILIAAVAIIAIVVVGTAFIR